jgi:hypothetical protein
MRKRFFIWMFAAAALAAALVSIGVYQRDNQRESAIQPSNSQPTAVIQGVIPEQLPPTTIPTDFLWGAGKFASFSVYAPAGQDLRIEEMQLRREGGSDAIMPTIWVRMNRERIYTEIPITGGEVAVREFPKPELSDTDSVRDVMLDVLHRVLLTPAESYTVPAGESAVVEVFGNINADALAPPAGGSTPIRFCLDSLRGSLISPDGTAEPAESRLNETCWSRMTIVPAP